MMNTYGMTFLVEVRCQCVCLSPCRRCRISDLCSPSCDLFYPRRCAYCFLITLFTNYFCVYEAVWLVTFIGLDGALGPFSPSLIDDLKVCGLGSIFEMLPNEQDWISWNIEACWLITWHWQWSKHFDADIFLINFLHLIWQIKLVWQLMFMYMQIHTLGDNY